MGLWIDPYPSASWWSPRHENIQATTKVTPAGPEYDVADCPTREGADPPNGGTAGGHRSRTR